MTADQRIRNQIKDKIEQLPSEKLADVLDFLASIDDQEKHIREILSFAGSWQDLDQEVVNDLTIDLHKNRMVSNREIEVE
ncbi:MAG: hypothetical protein IPN33_09175 [Saprospiraceae bacterium]|nr:hypothetical protein [Saprospiraceae bacterium]